MSLVATQDAVLAAIVPAATAAAAALPSGAPLATGEPVDGGEDRDELLPGPRARAAEGRLVAPGLTGSLAVLVSGRLAGALEQGAAGAQELVAGLAPALNAMVEVLVPGGHLEDIVEVDAEAALGHPDDGRLFAAVPLREGYEHVATIAANVSEPVAEVADAPADDTDDAHEFQPLNGAASGVFGGDHSLRLLNEVEMGVTAELGRTRMTVREILGLAPGAIVELDRAAGAPIDVLVNGTLIARGEVVVIDEEFGIRISEIVGQDGDI